MQLFVFAIVFALFGHDAQQGSPENPSAIDWRGIAALIPAHVAWAVFYWGGCRYVFNLLSNPRGAKSLRRLDAAATPYRIGVLALYSLGLWYGTLRAVRQAIGDLVLIDELLVMLPPLAMAMWSWWAYYPIDRRLREAPLMRYLDAGSPVQPIWTRGQFVVSQIRHQVLLTLVPLTALMGWVEAVGRWVPAEWEIPGFNPRLVVAMAGAVAVFLLTPVVIRYVWDTTPLPPGELRDRLMAMCRQHGVRVRELLLWRTFGGIMNGAVMGVVAPVRYILLTDALLEQLTQDELEAVMAHELAHIKRHHMFWLIVAATVCLGGFIIAWAAAIESGVLSSWAGGWGVPAAVMDNPDVQSVVGTTLAIGSWIAAFGWVSRRFERQADTFAVQHIASRVNNPAGLQVFDTQSVGVMVRALQRVADLNNIPTDRRSWRHGSIAWRQDYLRGLSGQRLQTPAIDQHILAIKIGCAVIVIVTLCLRWVA